MQEQKNMKFIHSGLLYLIPVIIFLIAAVSLYAAAKRKKLLFSILGSRSEDNGAVLLSPQKRFFRIVLAVVIMSLLAVVCARPYWSISLTPELPRGRDIIVLFDVSKSMLSDDVAPSRIEHGKFLLRQIIGTANEDRFGIAAFAGTSYLACPLTANRTALDEYIDELNCDMVPVGGTNLAAALKNAFRAFKAAEGNHRAVVLITDGDELTGNAQKEINQLKEMKIPVFAVGIGDPSGVPVKDSSGGIVRTKDGKVAMTKLNAALLKAIASATGGTYIHSTAADPGVEKLISRIDRLGKAGREGVKRVLPIDKFPGFLIAAFILYVIYMLISERSIGAGRKCVKAVIFAAFMFLPSLSAAENTPEPEKNDGNMTAQQLYNRALEEQTKGADASALYAETLHKAADERDIQGKSYYNLAVQSHTAARKNISAAEKMISAQQLEQAEKSLDTAGKELAEALPNYNTAFSYGLNIKEANLSTSNLTAHYLDLKKVKELKKKIDELKKQQQKAQQDTKNAQQKNKDKKQSQQQKQHAIDQAKKSAQNLKDKAEKMNQKELEKRAGQAEKSLEKAAESNRQNKPQETQKHLDDAARALGENGEKKNEKKQQSGQPQADKKEDKPLEKQPQTGNVQPQEPQEKIDKRSAEQLLNMLKKDEQQRRSELLNRSRRSRVNVEKDW